MPTIILTGGGSAGHCTPNLALIPHLKKHFDKIIYIGSKRGIERDIIEKEGILYFPVSTAKLKRSFSPTNLTIPFEVAKGINESKKIIEEFKPDVIFSKGGFVSVPVVIAGHRCKVPVICHESDYSLGLANKISLSFCDKLLTSFPDTAKNIKKATYVGCPIRKEIFSHKKDYEFFGFSGAKPVVLVFGGSLGSKAINESIRNALPYLLSKFDIIHICGKNNLLNDLNGTKGYYQTEYLYNIEKALAVASVCVARAGSNSLFELLALKIPCVIIPLPKGISRGDQIQNAVFFQRRGLITVIDQKALTGESIAISVNSTYANRANTKKAFELYPVNDSSSKIVDVICDYIR